VVLLVAEILYAFCGPLKGPLSFLRLDGQWTLGGVVTDKGKRECHEKILCHYS